MERETTQHSGRLDDAMTKETDSLTHGAPVEARVDENRLQEDAADDEPVAESLVSGEPAGGDFYGPSYRATRERSELARHLRPSIFPATPTVLVQCAREEHADDALVDRLSALPNRSYENPTQVWEALGGETEPTRTSFAKREPIPDSPVPDEMAAGPHDATASLPRRFEFRFDWRYRLVALPLGITRDRAFVSIEDHRGERLLRARFGFWEVCTPLANVVDTTRTGPYALPKTIGPPHVSLRDRGLTFATSNHSGLCITFAEAVPGVEPLGLLRHPSLTVTVADIAGLADALVAYE